MLGVYIHIPFCQRKCSYCAFSSFVREEAEQEKYICSLIQEIEDFAKQHGKREIDSIYIGGGTPSLLPEKLIEKIVEALKSSFIWTNNLEFSIESNPNSLTEKKLQKYKEMGINRISIGVQSLENEKLKTIGRLHTKEDAIEKIKLAGKYFDNINVDMLIGLPQMNLECFLQQIEFLASLKITHISAYMLQIEDGTLLQKMAQDKEIFLPEDDDSVCAYEKMSNLLKKLGFERYEVSNFAKEGYECKHNFKYWTGEEYIGFGLSAHSFFNGIRTANAKTFEDYYQRKPAFSEKLSPEQQIEEHIMLGLRCKNGVSKQFLKRRGYDITQNENLKEYIAKEIVREKDDKLFLNPEYYGVNNYIIFHLLP